MHLSNSLKHASIYPSHLLLDLMTLVIFNRPTNQPTPWRRVHIGKLITTQSRNFHLLSNLKFHYCVHKSLMLVPILSWMHPVNNFPPYLRPILVLSSHLCPDLPSGLLPSGFLTNILYLFHISPMPAKSPTTLILLD
jgi:hypothetical protein